MLFFLTFNLKAQLNPGNWGEIIPSQTLFSTNFNNDDCNSIGIDDCYAPDNGMSTIASFGSLTKPYFTINKYKVASLSSFNSPIRVTLDKSIFKVDQNGNVGINTGSPSEKLHVNGNSFTTGNSTIEGNSIINGNVGIGTVSPQAKLDVRGDIYLKGDIIIRGTNSAVSQFERTHIKLNSDGTIRAREIKVDLATIPDYVFAEDYNLMPLAEVKAFIETNKHLPNVKSEAQFKEEGSISLTEMNMKLLEKVEELTLYILQQEERIQALENNGGLK